MEMFVNCRHGYDVRCDLVGETGTVSLPEPAVAQLRSDSRQSVAAPPDWLVRFADAYDHEIQ